MINSKSFSIIWNKIKVNQINYLKWYSCNNSCIGNTANVQGYKRIFWLILIMLELSNDEISDYDDKQDSVCLFSSSGSEVWYL